MRNTGQILKAKRTSNFTILSNEILQSETLSFKAKGMLAYLLSLPSDWVLYKSQLHKNCKEGVDAIRSIWKELEEEGYIISVKMVDSETGHFSYNHVVYDYPAGKEENLLDEPTHCDTVYGFSNTVNPPTVNPTLQSTNKQSTNNTNPPIVPQEKVELLYDLYPSNCPVKGRSLGKTLSDKEKIRKRIRELGFDYVKNSISYYLDNAKKSESYLKNFSTLLNNLPEPPKSYTAERKIVKVNKTWDDNSGNHCADYKDEDGNIYSMKQVEFDYPTRTHYVKPEYQ